MKIIVETGKTHSYVFHNVPAKVARAVITILKECEKEDSEIISSEHVGA